MRGVAKRCVGGDVNACVCFRACVRACVRSFVCACMRVFVCTGAGAGACTILIGDGGRGRGG